MYQLLTSSCSLARIGFLSFLNSDSVFCTIAQPYFYIISKCGRLCVANLFFFRTLIKLLTSFTCSVLGGWRTLELHPQLGLHRLQKVSIKVQMVNSLPPTGLFIADDNLRTTAMPRWIFEVNGRVSSKQETQWIQGDLQLTVNHFLVLVYLY